MTGLDGITDEPGTTAWWGPEVRGGVDGAHLEQLIVEACELTREQARALAEADARRYLVLQRLGASSHARVYLALDRVLARRVVLKLHEDGDGQDEARWATLAEHPNVIDVHDHGWHEDQGYTVLHWCEGTSLDAWCEGKPWREVLARVIEAGRGLQHCHDHMLVHGDVKPQNILVTQGRAVLADFGLAGPPQPLEQAGGTHRYIAPELARYKVRGPKADVYALAVTAWRCLFGVMPYRDKSVTAAFLRSIKEPPDPPESPPPEFPDEVTEQLIRALIPNARERPPMGRWLDDLSRAAEAQERRRDYARRATRIALVLMVGMLTGIASHSVRGACVEQPHASAAERTIEDAIASAKSGDPFGARSVLLEIDERDGDVSAEDALRLAKLMLEATKKLPSDERGTAAPLVQQVASRAGMLARSASDRDGMKAAQEVWDAADEIIRSNPPSRPR